MEENKTNVTETKQEDKISSFSFVLILCLYDFNTHYCNR